jgi:hypothetical protein
MGGGMAVRRPIIEVRVWGRVRRRASLTSPAIEASVGGGRWGTGGGRRDDAAVPHYRG